MSIHVLCKQGFFRQTNQYWWLLLESRVWVFDLRWKHQERRFLSSSRFPCSRTKCHLIAWSIWKDCSSWWKKLIYTFSEFPQVALEWSCQFGPCEWRKTCLHSSVSWTALLWCSWRWDQSVRLWPGSRPTRGSRCSNAHWRFLFWEVSVITCPAA